MRNTEGESVAAMWGRLLQECQEDDCEIADKWGNVVAVMMSKDRYDNIHEWCRNIEDEL